MKVMVKISLVDGSLLSIFLMIRFLILHFEKTLINDNNITYKLIKVIIRFY